MTTRASRLFFLLGMAACGPSASPSASAVMALPHPSPPTAVVATGLEDATSVVKMYDHESVDPENAMPTVGGYVRVRAPLDVAFKVATRFEDYKDLNPDYIEQSTIVDRHTVSSLVAPGPTTTFVPSSGGCVSTRPASATVTSRGCRSEGAGPRGGARDPHAARKNNALTVATYIHMSLFS